MHLVARVLRHTQILLVVDILRQDASRLLIANLTSIAYLKPLYARLSPLVHFYYHKKKGWGWVAEGSLLKNDSLVSLKEYLTI